MKRILIAEDDEILYGILSYLIKEDLCIEEIEIIHVTSIAEALTHLNSHDSFSFIMTDGDLKDGTADKIIRAMNEDQKHVCIIYSNNLSFIENNQTKVRAAFEKSTVSPKMVMSSIKNYFFAN